MNYSLKSNNEYLISGYPSILEPQLKDSNKPEFLLDATKKGLIVSLDYGSTMLISLFAGNFQVFFILYNYFQL